MQSPRPLITLQREQGFSLIELMVVMAIIAVLAMVAVPAYRNYMLQGNRAEGKNLLLDAAAKEEQYFMDNKTYTSDMTDLGYAADPAVSEHGYYDVDVKTPTTSCALTNCFILEAAPQGGQTDDACATLTLNSDGEKGTSSSNSSCW